MGMLLPGSVFAIDVEEVVWGFNNQHTSGKCIPLSILLRNNTPEAFDEPIQLNRLLYGGSKTGAPLMRKIFLAPFSSQWVQFYPYIIGPRQEDWSINWGPEFIYGQKLTRAENNIDSNAGLHDVRSRIILSRSDALVTKTGHFKRFPEELFPPSVTATDSLDEILIGHVPRWDTARKVSFMDWLYEGGIVHLLPDETTGNNLSFTSSMVELNSPLEFFRIGEGLVIRHTLKMPQMTENVLTAAVNKIHDQEAESILHRKPETRQSKTVTDQYSVQRYGDINSRLMHQLTDLTHPDHNWPLIYLMSLLYLFMIFPGCFLFNKRQKNSRYRNSLLFILLTVVCFSTIFWSIGKRGYGEKTTINSLLVAEPLQGNYFDTTCWINSFVTNGGKYQFTSSGAGSIFTTAQETERINGIIANGIDGFFKADIPAFSSRQFMSRIKIPYSKPECKVVDYELNRDGNLKDLTLEFQPGLPANHSRSQVLFREKLYSLGQSKQKNGTLLRLKEGRVTPVATWRTKLQSDLGYGPRYAYGNQNKDPKKVYSKLYETLVIKSLDLTTEEQVVNYRDHQSRFKLFYYCDIPDEFKLKTDVRGDQQGRILFIYDFALPEKQIAEKNESADQ
ncbi:hypothetical protein [Gimesia algae]|uniref:Uncharacterized protein n=1 Tax=Gimesia algae TaxID=2527971 RepID=A0A517V7C8_9PLAN|nr:hypothetical protein [Gimesia algae]QDT88892.1 hypothetical protein Pan161_05110 [Gimesia algae]